MKNVIFLAVIALALISCKKEIIINSPILVNGVHPNGYDNVISVEKFTADNIKPLWDYLQDVTSSWDSSRARLFAQVEAMKLPSEKSTTVYLATLSGLDIENAEIVLKNSGWKMASLAQVGGLINQYNPWLPNSFVCINLPSDVLFDGDTKTREAFIRFYPSNGGTNLEIQKKKDNWWYDTETFAIVRQ